MALLKRRQSRTTGEALCTITPTKDELVEQRGTIEFSEEFLRGFLDNVRSVAVNCIETFFKGREMHCGGEIGEDEMRSDGYVSMVLNYDIGRGVDAAYQAMGPWTSEEEEERQQSFVVAFLDSCAKLSIPKNFAGGLLVMYMELCLGYRMRQPLPASYAA